MTRLYIITQLIWLLCRVHHVKCQAGWLISCNQDCQEKYQQPQIFRWYHSNGRKWRGTEELLGEGEKRRVKIWLETQHSKNKYYSIWSHHFMANRRENMEAMTDFFSWAPTSYDGYCCHKIKRHLLHGTKAITNLESVLKSRDITLLTKVLIVKAMVFPVVMYGRESWTIKKAEHQRIEAYKLWCWRRLLRVPWTVRKSNQSISPEYSLE